MPRRPPSSRRARTSARWPRRRGASREDAGEATRAAERTAQDTIAAAERAAAEARDRHTDVARRTDQLRTRLGGIEQAVAEIVGDIADAEMRRTFRQARLSSISDTQADRVAAGALRARIAELRAALVEAEGNCDRLAREVAMRVERLGQIAQDHAGWSNRLADAEGQIVELDARREQIAASIAELAAKPAEIEAKRMALGEEIDKAEHNRQEAADRLAVGETRLGEADKALKQAEAELSTRARKPRAPRGPGRAGDARSRERWSSASSSACAASPTACWRWPRSSRSTSCPRWRRPSIASSGWCTSARPWAR